MRTCVLKIFFISSLILFSACAPAMDGSSVRQPLNWELSELLPVRGSEATYISVELPPQVFNYDSDDVKALGGPDISRYDTVGTSSNTNIMHSFGLEEVVAPAGWDVKLERAYLVREITDRTTKRSRSRYYRSTSINTYYLETFRFTLSVTPTSVSDDETIMVTLRSPKGIQVVPLFVRPS